MAFDQVYLDLIGSLASCTVFFLPLCVILTEFHSCSEESASEEGSFLCSNPAAVCFICTVLRHKKKPILSRGLASE